MKKILLFLGCIFTTALANAQTNNFPTEQKQFGFQENKGQFEGLDKKAASYVLFKAEAPNLNIWVTSTGLTYQFLKIENVSGENNGPVVQRSHTKIEAPQMKGEWHRVDMVLKGASIKTENVITEGNLTQGAINFYHANSPSGVFNVMTYTKITIRNIYPGIDWQLYTSGETLEHDFIVHPNADPNMIKLIYEGSGSMSVENHSISFKNEIGDIREGQLFCYQANKNYPVAASYSFKKNSSLSYAGAGNGKQSSGKIITVNDNLFSGEISIQTGNYNRNETLIIDPQLVWGTYFGGPIPEQPRSIACDKNGNVFITGVVMDVGFPTQVWGGAYNQSIYGGGLDDAFIMGFGNTGVLKWATYYGGGEGEWANSIVCDANNNVYITGTTVMDGGLTVSTFPLQNLAGAFNQTNPILSDANAFLLRFNSLTGACDWGTFCAEGEARSITCDVTGNIYITGSGMVNPAQTWTNAYNDSTFGGGFDIFILRFTSAGVLTWATNYGGANYEEGIDITTDEGGNIYITGSTTDSLDTFIRPGAFNQSTFTGGLGDGFILRFTSAGVLTWATYYPGTTQCTNIVCDQNGYVYVTGYSSDVDDGPLQTMNWPGAYNQPTYGGGAYDACIMRFSPEGALTWSTYYGGADQELIGNFSSGAEMAIDPCGNVNISLTTLSTNPTTIDTYSSCGQYFYSGAALGSKAFLLKFTETGALSWATLYGGNGSAAGWGFMLALDKFDDLFVTKAIYEPNFQWPFVDPGNGAYFDTIADLNEDLYIAKFAPVLPTFTQSQINDSACSCGSATITITCGEPNYSYVWSNGNVILNTDSASSTITGLSPGTYNVTASSACNENVTATFIISGVAAGIEEANNESIFTVYPNPSRNNFFVRSIITGENIELTLLNLVGQQVYSENLSGKNVYEIHPNVSSGMYMLQLTNNKKKQISKLVIEE